MSLFFCFSDMVDGDVQRLVIKEYKFLWCCAKKENVWLVKGWNIYTDGVQTTFEEVA